MMNKIVILVLFACLSFSCKTPEARIPVSVSSGSFIDDSVARNKKLFKKEQDQIQAIIDANPSVKYIASESGFWYFYNTKNELDSITPNFGDIVNFDYKVKDFNDIEIYSDDEIKPEDYAMDQEELFTGLREGLKLMKSGETVTFLFPSQKAYGYYGDMNKIGANVPLICEVTIHQITQNQND